MCRLNPRSQGFGSHNNRAQGEDSAGHMHSLEGDLFAEKQRQQIETLEEVRRTLGEQPLLVAHQYDQKHNRTNKVEGTFS